MRPIPLGHIPEDNRNRARRTTRPLTNSLSNQLSNTLLRLIIATFKPLYSNPRQTIHQPLYPLNIDKKPSHKEKFSSTGTKAAGSILKILITNQKGKDIIARQDKKHITSEKHIPIENHKNHQTTTDTPWTVQIKQCTS